MKSILTILLFFIFVVSGSAQTRNVVVGTNGAVVQPTNFWSADVTNARSGLGLGSAATNPASAFQPASSVLSNLVSGGALTFSNITVGISNVTGLQTALDGKLGTNPTLFIANISNLQTTLDSKLGTNPTLQISNIAALQTALDAKLTASFPLAISNVSGLQSALDTKLGTNPTLGISNITGLQTNLDSKLSTTGSAANLTNFPTVALASNITGTAALATNVTGVVALVNGGTGATNISGARTALGVGSSDVFVGLTNLGSGGNLGFSSSPYILGSTNSTTPNNAVLALDSTGVRSVAGLTLAALTNTTTSGFRSAIGALATNGDGFNLTNLNASNITGIIPASNISTVNLTNIGGTLAINSGGTGATNAGSARANLGLGWGALTNANSAAFLLGHDVSGVVVYTNAGNLTFDSSLLLATTNNAKVFIGLTNIAISRVAGSGNLVVDHGTNKFQFKSSGEFSIDNGPLNVASGFKAASRTNLDLGASWLTNTNVTNFRTDIGFSTNLQTLWAATNITNARSSLGLSLSVLTNTSIENFKNDIGLSWTGLTNTNASGFRSALELSASWLTNTNVTNFRTAVGLGTTNDVVFNIARVNTLTAETGQVLVVQSPSGLATLQFDNNTLDIDAATFQVGAAIEFKTTTNAAITRTNLGLGWPALTNTNSGTGLVSVNTNGEVVSPTNFWQVAPIVTRFVESTPVVNQTTNILPSRRIHIHSLAISTTNITNTVALPTLGSFDGDLAMVVHRGPESSTTKVRTAGTGSDLVSLNKFDEAVEFVYYNNEWQFLETASFTAPVYFSGTNSSNNAANSRTNFGLGATWLTNTNAANFRTAIGVPSSFGSGTNSTIGGGVFNSAITNEATVSGGSYNTASGLYAVVGGGFLNTSSGQGAFVGGGNTNTASGPYSSVGGGQGNIASSEGSAVLGGLLNKATNSSSVVGGGNQNTAGGLYSTVVGGFSGAANGSSSVVVGGQNNAASGQYSATVGGAENIASGSYSFSAGNRAMATNNGAFVWSDSQTSFFASTNIDSFNVRAIGGMSLDLGSNGIIFRTNISAAATRTNLGLPLPALTNTSVTNFQKAIFYTNTAPSNIGGNLGTIAAWIEIVASNGVTYKIPAYTNVP